MKILFVCTGNICRSPTAHAIARHKAKELNKNFLIDSAGIDSFHAGENPDYRAREVGSERGIDFTGIKSRQITQDDFANFDLIFAMDKWHLKSMNMLAPQHKNKIHLFLEYAGINNGTNEVKDPYYGGIEGFNRVFDLIEEGVEKILSRVA